MAMKLINPKQIKGLSQAYQDIKSLLDGNGVDLSKVMTDVVKTAKDSIAEGNPAENVYYNAEELLEKLENDIERLDGADNVTGSVNKKIKDQVLDKVIKDYVKVNITAFTNELATTNDADSTLTYVAGNYPVFNASNEAVFDTNHAQVTAAVTAAGAVTLNTAPYTFSGASTDTAVTDEEVSLAVGGYDIVLDHKKIKNVSVTKNVSGVDTAVPATDYTVDYLQGKVQLNNGVESATDFKVSYTYETVAESKAAVAAGTVAYKIFPVASKTFGTLEADFLLDNAELRTVLYNDSITKLAADIAQNTAVINQIAGKVADVEVQNALKKATEELEAALAAQGDGMNTRVTNIETILPAGTGANANDSVLTGKIDSTGATVTGGQAFSTVAARMNADEDAFIALKSRMDAVKYTVEEGGENVEKDLVDRFVRDEAEVTALKTSLGFEDYKTVLAANSDTSAAQTFGTLAARLNDGDERTKALEDEIIAARTSTAVQTNSANTVYGSLDARLEAIETKEAADKTAIDTELGANVLVTATANSNTGSAKNHATVDARITDAESRIKAEEDKSAVIYNQKVEEFTPTAQNGTTITLTMIPCASTIRPIHVYVNGIVYHENNGFTVNRANKTITWTDDFALYDTIDPSTGVAYTDSTVNVAEVFVEYFPALDQSE